MIRSFDLASSPEVLNHFLDDLHFELQSLKVSCSDLGLTTLIVEYQRADEVIPRQKRRVERHLLFYGTNPELNATLGDETTELIKMQDFFTAQGIVVVIDYQIKERS